MRFAIKMQMLIYIIIGVCVIAVAIFVVGGVTGGEAREDVSTVSSVLTPPPSLSPTDPDLAVALLNQTELSLETATSLAQRVRGLSGRANLAWDTGLLFVFPDLDYHGIWMKEMNFPIDIIWLDDEGIVVDIKEGAEPASYPEVFTPKAPARYVLEVNAGVVRQADIKVGEVVQWSR